MQKSIWTVKLKDRIRKHKNIMLKKLPLLLLIILCSCKAQDKVKGSRNVKTEQYDLEKFHSIQIKGEFEVGILKGRRSMIEIEADDNIHDLIMTEVLDGTLYIKPIKKLSRTKKQELRITFSDTLKSILIGGDVELESLQDLYVNDFKLETGKDAKAFLTLTASKFNFIHKDDAEAELNVIAKEIVCQLNQSSKVEALLNAPDVEIDIYEKASARIDGETQIFNLRADQSSKFDGENFSSLKAEVLAQGNSSSRVNVSDTLNLIASGKSEVEVYNTPVIKLLKFSDEASLSKKEFSKGLFK